MKPIDMTGERRGKLTVVGVAGTNAHGERTWMCRCDCGHAVVVGGYALRSGSTKSCGCARADANVARLQTHGLKDSPAPTTRARDRKDP